MGNFKIQLMFVAMLEFLESVVPLAPLRKSADHRSALYSQLLMGDLVQPLGDAEGDWLPVQVLGDEQQVYVLRTQVQPTSRNKNQEQVIFSSSAFLKTEKESFVLSAGTRFEITDKDRVMIGGVCGELTHHSEINPADAIFQFLGSPYQWGGMSIFGIDCSGLSAMYYRFRGIQLPHLASAQIHYGQPLDFLSTAQKGDLAFFENSLGEIHHVGILLNDREILHASESNGCVRIDYIDQEGIILKRGGTRTHRLRLVKRLGI